MSLTNANFGDAMRSALEDGEGTVPAVTDGEEEAEYDKCLLEEDDATSVVDVHVVYQTAGAGLMLPPVRSASSQMGSQEVDVDERLDDRDLETQGSILSTLTSKTQKVKEMKRDYALMLREMNKISPFVALASKHEEISILADGEAKQGDIALYNAICTIFDKCRHDEQTRKFVGDLFSNTQSYYEYKEQKKEAKYQVSLTPHFPARISSSPTCFSARISSFPTPSHTRHAHTRVRR